jgi:hypothetical protein
LVFQPLPLSRLGAKNVIHAFNGAELLHGFSFVIPGSRAC